MNDGDEPQVAVTVLFPDDTICDDYHLWGTNCCLVCGQPLDEPEQEEN